MDEGLTEDVAHIDMPDVTHLQYKDGEQSFKPENCEVLEPKEMAVQGNASSPETSFDVLAKILEGKNVNTVEQTENPCSSSQTTNDPSDMVEELTMRNYDGSNVAIVDISNNRESLQGRQKQFLRLHRMVGGSTGSSSHNERDFNQAMPSNTLFPGSSTQKACSGDHIEANEQLVNVERNAVSSEMTSREGGIKTKILSKSGFSEFFVKTTLKGKGIICKGQPHDRFRAYGPKQKSTSVTDDPKVGSNASVRVSAGPLVASDASLGPQAKTSYPPSSCAADSHNRGCESDCLSLREWLKSKRHKVNKAECLYVFRQIVDLVDYSHSQGVVLHDLRPSCFRMLQGNQVKYIGSGFHRDSRENVMNKETFNQENHLVRRSVELGLPSNFGLSVKKQRFSDNTSFSQWPLFQRASIKSETGNENDVNIAGTKQYHTGSCVSPSNTTTHPFSCMSERLEEKWYSSPEELGRGICTIPSNIYSLGILLFELLGCFDSERAREAAMSDIRHRILPPNFLSENPKEAGFCLWLLHPEPSSRPTTRDIIQSEVINGAQEMVAEELSLSIGQEDTESELLLHFLVSLQEKKQNHTSKLVDDIVCLEADIEEVEKRRSAVKAKESSNSKGVSCLSLVTNALPEMRLIRNIHQLESAYFCTRTHAHLPEINHVVRPDRDLLRDFNSAQENVDTKNPSDRVGAFFDGLCKYARYSKFEMRGVLRTGEFSNSANVICSLGFDRDEDYIAAASVSKKIKIYEFNALFNDSVDIHYPAIEMPNKSKLSCVCWNSYVKNYLASSDYDGTVKLWDVSTGQAVSQFSEHEKRAWSVDFSQVYPTKLASGSDDGSVKLWNINERNCLGTIRNIANVCCVQFSPHSTNLLAFGSADYRTYCYDLRNLRGPWCVLTSHDKAVSYVKFLDHETLVTASTDNTLKLWDLKKTTQGLSTNACSLTFSGHTNEKNFVGLSTANGYIACGSETNEVYAYYRSLPMPITSYKFGSIDPISGRETDDDNGLFVSSVCWRKRSEMVVTANSSGCIKLLQMV